jgi:uncharacterized protein YjbI with pentapeptide repeats
VRFENTDEFKGAEFVNVDLSGARFRNVDLTGAKLMEAQLVNARFSGLIHGLVVNDVEVGPLIHAELIRRYPERAKLLPSDMAGVREGWSVIEDLWAATKARVSSLPKAMLHERVDDEWSFLETLRHLIMVTDGWISGTVLGRTGHFSSIGVMPSFMTDPEQFGIDPTADPSLAEVVPVREERLDVVRELIADLTDEGLQRACGDQTVLTCLWTLFEEEWQHNWFANRDLDVLARRES